MVFNSKGLSIRLTEQLPHFYWEDFILHMTSSIVSRLFHRGGVVACLLLLSLAFIGCGDSDNFVFTNSPATPTGPTATGLVFQTTPLRTAGQTFNAINVAVVDQDGAVVAGATNEITIALANPNGATLSGTLTRNAVNGVAGFDNLSVDLAGNYTFIATSPGLDSAQSVAFVVTPDVATQVAFVQQPTDIKVGASFDPQVTLEVLDAFGNRVTEVSQVTLTIASDPSGTATLIGTTTVDTINGLATFPSDLAATAGVGTGFTLQAESDGATATSEAFDVGTISVALVRADFDSYAADVQAKLTATGVFSIVDDIYAGTETPTLADLQDYDAVLLWTNWAFADSTLLGDRLANYFDDGGRVVVAAFANATYPIGGRFVTGNYLLIDPAGRAQAADSLGTINEPGSPLLVDVTTFAATSSYSGTGGPINGGIVVAEWGNGRPLVVRGSVNGRNRVDLNFYPPSLDARDDCWTGDGAELMRNALLFQ